MNVHQQTLHFKLYKTVGTTRLWQIKGESNRSPFFYEAGIIIDYDGAPDAYAPRGSGLVGKDNLGNAVAITDKSGQSPWLVPPAKQTDPPTNPRWTPTYASTVRDHLTGASVRQTSGRYAGYYISESSLKDVWHAVRGPTQTDPAYQTDANVFPYVVLPGNLLKDSYVKVGDYALAINGQTGRYTFALYGDAKKKPVMGESSSALATALLGRSAPAARGIIYLVFPDSGISFDYHADLGQLPSSGMRWLRRYNDRLNLAAQITSCFSPEFPGVAQAFRTMGL